MTHFNPITVCQYTHEQAIKGGLLTLAVASISMLALVGCAQGPEVSPDEVTLAQLAQSDIGARSGSWTPYDSRNDGAWGGVYMTQAELIDNNRNIVNYDLVPPYDSDPELEKWKVKFGSSGDFDGTDGAKLYHDSCAACHMHEGEGAYGAGYYPPLADNPKMHSKYYIIDILINGFRGMPRFNEMMDDEQIAAVTQYVMRDLNGLDTAVVTADDVAQLRHSEEPSSDGR